MGSKSPTASGEEVSSLHTVKHQGVLEPPAHQETVELDKNTLCEVGSK